MRVGIGYDVHPLVEESPLVLGGVTVPFSHGLTGHSDGDALTHAVIDALLGAAGLGDIGTHFPSSDAQYRGIASTLLLRHTAALLASHGWRVVNVDATIIAERPRLGPYLDAMRQELAMHIAALDPGRVGAEDEGDGDALLEQSYVRDPSRTVGELIQESIARTGENIRVSDFARFEI